MSDIGIYNDYWKSIHVRKRGEERILVIADRRHGGTWHERELEENKLKALKLALTSEDDWDTVRKEVFKLIRNPDDFCMDFKKTLETCPDCSEDAVEYRKGLKICNNCGEIVGLGKEVE